MAAQYIRMSDSYMARIFGTEWILWRHCRMVARGDTEISPAAAIEAAKIAKADDQRARAKQRSIEVARTMTGLL